MNSKQRVKTTLAHRQPDRIAIDFGSTSTSGIHVSCVAALREHYGFAKRPVKVTEPYQMLGEVDDELRDAMGIDTVGMLAPSTIFGFPLKGWHEWRTPWGQDVLVAEGFKPTHDDQGNTYLHPQGDTTVPASGHLPMGGYFFDAIIRQEPIDETKLDPADNLEEFGPLSEQTLAHFTEQTALLSGSARAVVAGIPGTAFGDIALVPATFLKHPKGIRDIEEWYVSLVMRQDYVHAVFERQCDIALKNLARLHAVVGETINVAFICGTDFGTQTSSFCSDATFRQMWLPYYKRVNDWIHANTSWKTLKHSCGSVRRFMASFIECGFDILNPVQCSATGMDAAELKAEFGADITFWGGGIDTQHVLPFGTPAQVRRQVLERCEAFAPDGGFVYNTIHNIQALTPTKNIIAMVDAVHEYSGVRRDGMKTTP
jgi:hypothetical protein